MAESLVNPLHIHVSNYARQVIISSKLLLEEDFDILYELPELNIRPANNKRALIVNALGCTIGATICFVYSKYKLLPLILMPFNYAAIKKLAYWKNIWSFKRTIRRAIRSLENQFVVNKESLKYLQKQNDSYNSLRIQLGDAVSIDELEQSEIHFANATCETLYELCQFLQNCFKINESLSPKYEDVIFWKIDQPKNFASLQEACTFLSRTNDFYLLLVSHFLSFSYLNLQFNLNNTEKFRSIITLLRKLCAILDETTEKINRNLRGVQFRKFYTVVSRETLPERHENQKLLEEFARNLQIASKLVLHDSGRNDQVRRLLLEEALEHLSCAEDFVKLLIRTIPKEEKLKKLEMPRKQELIDKEEDAVEDKNLDSSEDEEFCYSPKDSDDETNGFVDDIRDDSYNSAAVQRLIVKELMERIRNVKRIKIYKNSRGDLIVKKRESSVTPEVISLPARKRRSKEAEEAAIEDDWFSMPKTMAPAPLPPPPPSSSIPPPPVPRLPTTADCSQSMLQSITSIAKQINIQEDTFGSGSEEDDSS